MGIGEGARPRQAQNAAQPHQGLLSVSFLFFLSFFSLFFLYLFFYFFFSRFFLSLFSPSFQNKLDKMQIGSSEDVNDLNYYYDNEWWVARGGN